MKNTVFYFILSLAILACTKNNSTENITLPPSKIAFGSCCVQIGDLSIFDSILKQKPELYLALGDNMYGDFLPGTYPDSAWLALNYNILGTNASFKRLKQNVPIVATYDDHDYGGNNRGNEYPFKRQTANLLLNFFNTPANSTQRNHTGVYGSYFYGDDAHKLQIIVLDTRVFLDVFSSEPISPTSDTTKHFLGTEEWNWLRSELLKPAKVRIVMSSTQMLHEHNGYESWTNYPHELQRFFNLIKETRAEGIFMVSGDVHWAELSMQKPAGLYNLYDMTSSGLNQIEDAPKPNIYRVGTALRDLNYGMINIDWNSTPISINLQVRNKRNQVKIEKTIPLTELQF
jgi:alkaline phosphatase D